MSGGNAPLRPGGAGLVDEELGGVNLLGAPLMELAEGDKNDPIAPRGQVRDETYDLTKESCCIGQVPMYGKLVGTAVGVESVMSGPLGIHPWWPQRADRGVDPYIGTLFSPLRLK